MTRRGVAVFLLVCALLGAAFYGLLEPHTRTVEGPLRGEAARNPYLALARLLEGMGVPVVIKRDLDDVETLPPRDSTVFLLGRRAYLTEKRSADLREWVEQGGHLVVQAWQAQDAKFRRRDPLLDALGVGLFTTEDDEGEGDEETEEREAGATEDEEEASDDTKPAPGPETGDGETEAAAAAEVEQEADLAHWSPEPYVIVRIEFDPRRTLFLPEERDWEPVQTWSDEAGDHGFSVPLGAGHVTVWSDGRFLRNDAIGKWDHAELAYRLVRMFDADGPTWIVVRDAARLSLWTRMRESAWSVLVALGAWLLFYLWSVAPRFGPIQPDPPAERRELMEHVRASGSFLLRNGGFDTLVSAVRRALLRRVQQRHPQWLLLDAGARVERVAEHTGLAAREIEDALESASSTTQRDTLVKRIATLEAIRKRL